jgi:hypothetical protein
MAQHIPTNWMEREALRDKGQFWTPDWVADAMVAYVGRDTDLVFDPATGGGAFLSALRRVRPGLAFYGTDIDEKVLTGEVYRGANTFVEHRDFLKNPPARHFKAIVANPPYIRHHRIDVQSKRQLKALAAQIAGISIDGRAGLHVYFLLQIIHLLAPGGRLAFLVSADICEGKFAPALWNWVTKNFHIECVATFSEVAAPFPSLDTNALIFFVKNEPPKSHLVWTKVLERGSEFQRFVAREFKGHVNKSICSEQRELCEALQTGFSRPPNKRPASRYQLSDFAAVMRGIATGANEFFFLTERQITELGLPREFFKRAVGRTRDVEKDVLTDIDMAQLDNDGRPTLLLSVESSFDSLPHSVRDYLAQGQSLQLPERALIRQRKPWYKQEKRVVPELLFTYLGRRKTRFIKNEAKVLPLHCLHCIYTYSKDTNQIHALWQALNHPDTIANLHFVSKSYGSGALKAEPQNLAKLPIPEHIVEQFGLQTPTSKPKNQLTLFN